MARLELPRCSVDGEGEEGEDGWPVGVVLFAVEAEEVADGANLPFYPGVVFWCVGKREERF